MSSSSYTSYTSAAGADDAGWTRVPSRSRFSGDAAAAFGSKQRPVHSSSHHGFSEEASSAFGHRSATSAVTERPARSSGYRTTFSEEAASAFGAAAKPTLRPGRRSEFDESAASAFGGGGSGGAKRYESSYRSAAAPATAKKQTYDEAFPTLGSATAPPTAPVTATTETRAPTLAEKLRKKAAEEAEAEERRKAAADVAAARYARDARERAMFASLSASRGGYMGASHYMDGYAEDESTHGYGDGDDLDYGAFGEAVEKPLTRRGPTPVPDHDYEDDY